MPYSIAFINEEGDLLRTLDYIINMVFLIDIILMFYTTYQNNHGSEVKDHASIVKNYLQSKRFFFDFLSFLGVLELLKR